MNSRILQVFAKEVASTKTCLADLIFLLRLFRCLRHTQWYCFALEIVVEVINRLSAALRTGCTGNNTSESGEVVVSGVFRTRSLDADVGGLLTIAQWPVFDVSLVQLQQGAWVGVIDSS